MKSHAVVLMLIGTITISTLAIAQTPPPTPISYLQSSVAAMVGQSTIQNVTLSGTAQSTAGSSNETGSFTANGNTNGSSHLSLQLTNDSHTDNIQTTNGIPSGNWVDSNSVQHSMAQHNLLTPASWFCPVVALSQIVSATNLNVQFIGVEQKNGTSLAHFTITAMSQGTGPQLALATHLSQVDIYLNPQTLMPVVFDFTAHPDTDAGTDIPIEVTFSNYTQVNGLWIPFTVERYVNTTLSLELQIQSVSAAPTGSNS